MSTGQGVDVPINGSLVARKDPNWETWNVYDADHAFRGRVVNTARGFQALKPFGTGFYSVGTFGSPETAARVVMGPSGPGRR